MKSFLFVLINVNYANAIGFFCKFEPKIGFRGCQGPATRNPTCEVRARIINFRELL